MPYETPEAAYDAFFSTFNAEDAEAWAGVMHYPHIRISAGTSWAGYFETAEEYAAHASWDRFKADGWVRTQSVAPVRVHESGDKVHLAGGWTRYDTNDRPILSNRVTYVLARTDSGWGIRARFGTDSFQEGEDNSTSAEAALDVVRRHLDAWDTADFSACSALAAYPLTDIGARAQLVPGERTRYGDRASYQSVLALQRWSATAGRELRAIQVGRTGVNVSVSADLADGRREHGLFLITSHGGDWRIIARSRIYG